MVALAWWTAGAPPEGTTLRRRLAWAFGLALLLRLAFEGLLHAPGAFRTAAAVATELVALSLLWPLLQLTLVGPFGKGGRPTRIVFTLVGLTSLWAADPGSSAFLLWI